MKKILIALMFMVCGSAMAAPSTYLYQASLWCFPFEPEFYGCETFSRQTGNPMDQGHSGGDLRIIFTVDDRDDGNGILAPMVIGNYRVNTAIRLVEIAPDDNYLNSICSTQFALIIQHESPVSCILDGNLSAATWRQFNALSDLGPGVIEQGWGPNANGGTVSGLDERTGEGWRVVINTSSITRIPAPATAALAIVGLLGVAMATRRSRRRATA